MKQLGKYELIRELGRGASSTVYLGRDPFAGREVAVKVATPEVLHDPVRGKLYAKLFLNEASLAGKLKHPHLVEIFDAVVADDLCYIVMEYVPGGTLEPFTQPGQLLPVERVLEIIFKCTRALDFAFQHGIIHRDIKPANLLLADEFNLKISDFGAAIATGTDRTQVSGIGSPAYMSPQQVREQPLDQRTDIYSLGVVMFQLLTGALPFAAENNFNMVCQIINATPAAPSTLRPELPAELDQIVLRAMARDLDNRYPDWESFGHDLAQAARNPAIRQPRRDFTEAEKFGTLRTLPFFADFSDVEIWEVLRFSHWEVLPAGKTIMRDGEPGDFFCFVAEGELKVSKQGKILNLLTSGDCFGEMAVINRHGQTRGADVATLTAAKLISIRGTALQQASEACRMHFYQGFLDVLAGRLSFANQRLAAF